ncbi:nucleoside/nucleotide kinase family protein [Isoptericola sp. NPDC057559]|uniref:nucleoside/nucleotide kinase family protein n=1 Tax=Isoptericola sp. NPDC057559 TaxID=3346168 RepID=UPI00369E014B
MTSMTGEAGHVVLPDDAGARLRALRRADRTPLLGLAGPPGAGKSTVADALARQAEADGMRAVVVPMDGFHLANPVLDALGRRGRKGAPDTFDVAGYVALLRRLRAPGRPVVYAPAFDRGLDAGLAGAVTVAPDVDLVITEGNYLLHDDGGWRDVAPELDAVWWVGCDDTERRRRLVDRHQHLGRSPRDAAAFVAESDEANARLVGPGAARASYVVTTGRAAGPA